MKLVLGQKEIAAPTVKTSKIEIDGADGSIDYTDFFGEVKYGEATHVFPFTALVPRSDFLSHYSIVKNALHGKKLPIILDDDPNFYYVGRCYVSKFTNEKGIGTISVECECEPYKYKKNETTILHSFSGKNLFNCVNPTIATAYNTEVTSLSTGVRITSLSQGQWRFAQFKIAPIKVLAGRTITLSCKATASAGAAARIGLGYFKNPYNPLSITMYSTSSSNTVSLTVDAKYAETYDSVGLWLYSSRDTDGQAGSYVEYTNVQLELGSIATAFEAYDSTSESATLTAVNDRKTAVPTVMASADITIGNGSFTTSVLADKEYRIPELELKEGENLFTVTGSGLCLIRYREGSL